MNEFFESPGSGRATARGADRFTHEALMYAGMDGFIDGTLPFIREGVDAGEPVLVVVSREKIAALTEALGERSSRVDFRDMAEVGRNPARIIPVWQDFIDEAASGGSSARGIGEPVWPERAPDELLECQHHEALLNVAFDDGPGWQLLCPYDTSSLDGDVVDAACASHRGLRRDGLQLVSDAFIEPEEWAGPFSGPLSEPPAEHDEVRVSLDGLTAARTFVFARARDGGLGPDKAGDLVLAVDEVISNSIRHGGGTGTLRLWQAESGLVCEVVDSGQIAEPLAGRRKPTPGQTSGYGLWLVNQLCDLVQIRSRPGETAIRMHMRGSG